MRKLRQAVILCGGVGSRLGALTEETPKPLLPVGGAPFLDVLLFELGRHGVKQVLLLAGFAAQRILDYAASTPLKGRFDLEIDGTRRVYRIHRVGADTYIHASDGSSTLAEVPRFGDPERAAPSGSLLAPMPGLVLRVLAEVGAVVTAGQPLLVLEAMKMEQTVSAPADGVVAELRAKAGEQVSTGQILAVLDVGQEGG